MTNPHHARFHGLDWYDTETIKSILPIVVGAGGTGSWLALYLGRIGYSMVVVDHDIIDTSNFGGQLYRPIDSGKHKAKTTAEIVEMFTGDNLVTPIVNKFGREEGDFLLTSPFMFACADSMKARREIFEEWRKQEDRELLIDSRMNSEYYEVFAVTKETEEEYEKIHLFDDSEVPDGNCSARATSHCGSACATKMIGLFNNYIANKIEDGGRDIPFYHNFGFHLYISNMEHYAA